MASKIVCSNVRQMSGYTPGEQPVAGERVVKLNTNENPFPPSAKVMTAIREIEPEMLRRYPHPRAETFCKVAAQVHGVDPGMILASNGSDDALTIATRTFIAAGGTLAFPDPTYSLYPVLARLQNAKSVAVAWEDDWQLPTDALLAAKADAIYLANPNAPSGTIVSSNAIAGLAEQFDGLLLVDEAYADFAEQDCIGLIKQYPNLIITRTLSKAYSLAGLRMGYVIAQPAMIAEMMKVKDSYNCDSISIVAGTAALLDREYAQMTWANIRNERQRVAEELERLGWSVTPSAGNFLLVDVPGGHGREAYLGLKQQGILVRFFDRPGLSDKLRITIGTSLENNALLGGIKALSMAEKAA